VATVKIDRNSSKGVSGAYRGAAPRPSAPLPTSPVSTGPNQVDQVTVSEKASRASAVKAKLAAAPEVRADRIAQLKEAIDAGSYRVESRQLADKLLKAKVLDE
jgi:flagellar biosynthesis anti-sigma factor FlgM